jgi:hypothetical protein
VEEEITIDSKIQSLLDPNPQRRDIPILTKLAKRGDIIFFRIYTFLTENLIVTNHWSFFFDDMKKLYKEDVTFQTRLNDKIKMTDI